MVHDPSNPFSIWTPEAIVWLIPLESPLLTQGEGLVSKGVWLVIRFCSFWPDPGSTRYIGFSLFFLSGHILNFRTSAVAALSILNVHPIYFHGCMLYYLSWGVGRVSSLKRYPKGGGFLWLLYLGLQAYIYTYIQFIVYVACNRSLFHHGPSECTFH